jgi:AbrB family looped-hinge helix DNA binding protein
MEVSRMDTGMARKIDDLGRIVIPAETRRLLNIHEGDQLAIEVEGDRIILRKREVTVAVGAHVFELDRNSVADWERKVATEIGTKDPEKFEGEIRRRLGF